MKRTIAIIAVAMLAVSLVAFTKKPANPPSMNGFAEAISRNPIDECYDGGPGTIYVNDRFTEYWEKEVEHTFGLLCDLLEAGDLEKLKLEQQLWLEFWNSPDLAEVLYERNKAELQGEKYEDYVLDSPSIQRLMEMRRRAYQLMEQYYLLIGEVCFIFEGPDEDAIVNPSPVGPDRWREAS